MNGRIDQICTENMLSKTQCQQLKQCHRICAGTHNVPRSIGDLTADHFRDLSITYFDNEGEGTCKKIDQNESAGMFGNLSIMYDELTSIPCDISMVKEKY